MTSVNEIGQSSLSSHKRRSSGNFFFLLLDFFCNITSGESIIVTEVTVRSSFITLSSQNPRNLLDKEMVILILFTLL